MTKLLVVLLAALIALGAAAIGGASIWRAERLPSVSMRSGWLYSGRGARVTCLYGPDLAVNPQPQLFCGPSTGVGKPGIYVSITARKIEVLRISADVSNVKYLYEVRR